MSTIFLRKTHYLLHTCINIQYVVQKKIPNVQPTLYQLTLLNK